MSEDSKLIVSYDYQQFLKALKNRITQAQVRAGLAVNRELVLLYWQTGRDILITQQEQGWGAKTIDYLSADLQQAFPGMKGFSTRNLKYMRAFAEAWPDEEIVQALLAQITWYHNIALIEKLSAKEERVWYAQKTIEQGWSRNVLTLQIENKLHLRQGKSSTNFVHTLMPPQSDLAGQVLKDPYNFDFLDIAEIAQERDLERSLIEHIREFLMELGQGFAFMGSQYHIVVEDKDYYIDLLFYHVKLHCYVVIELKATEFRPEYVGKLNFYLSAVDDLLRQPEDNPSIGLILVKTKSKVEAEYALRGVTTPIGISGFDLTKALPEKLKGSLPTIEELEAELESENGPAAKPAS